MSEIKVKRILKNEYGCILISQREYDTGFTEHVISMSFEACELVTEEPTNKDIAEALLKMTGGLINER